MSLVQKLFETSVAGTTWAGTLPIFPISAPGGRAFWLRDVLVQYFSNTSQPYPTSLFVLLGKKETILKNLLDGTAFTFRSTVAGPPNVALASYVPRTDSWDGTLYGNNYADGSVAVPSTIPANILRMRPLARILMGNWYDSGHGGWHHEPGPDVYVRQQAAGEDCIMLVPGLFHNIKDNTTFSDSPLCTYRGLFSCRLDYV